MTDRISRISVTIDTTSITLKQLAEAIGSVANAVDPETATVAVRVDHGDRPGDRTMSRLEVTGPPPQDEPEPPVREHRGGRVIRDTPQA